jgi:hypothetical protein
MLGVLEYMDKTCYHEHWRSYPDIDRDKEDHQFRMLFSSPCLDSGTYKEESEY